MCHCQVGGLVIILQTMLSGSILIRLLAHVAGICRTSQKSESPWLVLALPSESQSAKLFIPILGRIFPTSTISSSAGVTPDGWAPGGADGCGGGEGGVRPASTVPQCTISTDWLLGGWRIIRIILNRRENLVNQVFLWVPAFHKIQELGEGDVHFVRGVDRDLSPRPSVVLCRYTELLKPVIYLRP